MPLEIKGQNVNLDSLREKGAESLNLQPSPDIYTDLRQIDIAWEDRECHTTILRASDLLDPASSIPPSATIIRATFLLRFPGATAPVQVEVRPPDTIAFETTCSRELIDRWATRHGYASHLQE